MKSILKMITAERQNFKLNLSYASGVIFEFQLKRQITGQSSYLYWKHFNRTLANEKAS